jgi:hypothetical protein
VFDKSAQHSVRKPNLSNEIAAYIVNKRNNIVAGKVPVKNSNDIPAKQNAPVSNIRLVNKTGNRKALEFQILFGELENILLSMNINDATVQRALIKLNEIRSRILPELK